MNGAGHASVPQVQQPGKLEVCTGATFCGGVVEECVGNG